MALKLGLLNKLTNYKTHHPGTDRAYIRRLGIPGGGGESVNAPAPLSGLKYGRSSIIKRGSFIQKER